MRPDEYRAMFELEGRLWWYEGMRAITASILQQHLIWNMPPRILDAGCGTGYSLKWLREVLGSDDVFGVDGSVCAAEFFAAHGIETAAISSVTNLPFASDEFDLVTCFDVIYQLESEEAKIAVSEVHRVLKRGGALFIREPAYDWLRGAHDVAIGTRHRFTLGELRRLLRSSGFTIRHGTYANTLLFGAAVAHRLHSRLLGGGSSDVKPVPDWLNRCLLAALKLEAGFVGRFALPLGLSAIVLAEKEERR